LNWRAVGTIYAKELRDLLRDRRTLVSTIVIPTFIMPALMLVVVKTASTIVSKARAEIPRIMVIGQVQARARVRRLEVPHFEQEGPGGRRDPRGV
jgi:sodium transport system permease protein